MKTLLAISLGCFASLCVAPVEDRPTAKLPQQLAAILAEAKWPANETETIRATAKDGEDKSIDTALAERVFATAVISPEGRVKVERGPAAAELSIKRPGLFLLKIENHSGGQQRLKLLGTYTGATNPFAASIRKAGDFGSDLVGLPVEYRLIEITAAKSGRHELTLAVEAGQGSQDLGFRAEVPVLFTVDTD